jgi:hypothetical protein
LYQSADQSRRKSIWEKKDESMNKSILAENIAWGKKLTPFGLTLRRMLKFVWNALVPHKSKSSQDSDDGSEEVGVTAGLRPPPSTLSGGAAKEFPDSDE